MIGVLALDLATTVGWAYGVDGGAPQYGFTRLGVESTLGRRCSKLAEFLEGSISVLDPELVVFEAPVPKNQTSARGLIYLAGIVEMICDEQKVRVREQPPSTARKEVLGRGAFFQRDATGRTVRDKRGKLISETKDAVMEWARSQGWDPATHDVADALVLLEYAHIVGRMRRAA